MAFEDYYNNNPVSIVDRNLWTDREPQIIMRFQQGPTIYTPLVEWMDRSRQTGAQYSQFSEIIEGDTDVDEIAINAEYLPDPLGVDSRMRQITTARYGDKVMLHKSSNVFQMWKNSGNRDWRPLLQGVLGSNIVRKFETLGRNAYLKSPKNRWTYANGGSSFADMDSAHKFNLDIVNEWNLRVGQTGTPVIPGESASVRLAIVPPGVIYDFLTSLYSATHNEAQMWRDARIFQGPKLQYEIGEFKGVRFVEVPNDTYGQNHAILYNSGPIFAQAAVTSVINMGDGSPDPETTAVDDTWYVGQKAVTHYIQLKNTTDMSKFVLNDIVTIHTVQSNAYGITHGVDPLSGKTIQRRIVGIDAGNHRIAFDRPIMRNYKTAFDATLTGGSETGIYAIVTKATHVAFVLVLGAIGGIKGNVNKPLEFYTPKPVDDFESVWRYVWDIIAGYNVWDPSLFECHFCAVTIAKPGGIIAPAAPVGS